MLGVSLQNTTTDDFAFQLAARYLTFDVVGSGSELRVDGAVGAQPSIGAELYRPLGRTPFFVAPFALRVSGGTLNFVQRRRRSSRSTARSAPSSASMWA